MDGIIWDGSVPLPKCILEETLPPYFEIKCIPIMVHYDAQKMSG
jgi:hypothetical protein